MSRLHHLPDHEGFKTTSRFRDLLSVIVWSGRIVQRVLESAGTLPRGYVPRRGNRST